MLRLDLRAFGRDLVAYSRSPWPLSQRLKAVGLLFIHRWNRYSPAAWNPVLHLRVRHHRRPLTLSMRMDSDDFFAFQEIFVDHYYDQPLGEPTTILDLGANCGFATLLFAARYPRARLACVEPHPANLEALHENLRLNSVEANVVAGAVTHEDGPTRLFVSTSLAHSLIPGAGVSVDAALPVEGFSIPTLMARLGWERVDLLKIDIEGSERSLFAGRPAWLARVNRIVGEVHADYGFDALRADLCPLGFTVSALDQPHLFLAFRDETVAA